MSPWGSVPLRKYAGGGVARSPQFSIFGEGDLPEAYVPLPDGRTIPVTMRGDSKSQVTVHQSINVNVTNSNASPAMIAIMTEQAANRANQKLLQKIQEGGPISKAVGRRSGR